MPDGRTASVKSTPAVDSAASSACAHPFTVEQVPLLKLKDWPPTSDYAELLPQHFADLMQALPQPLYTRRTGALNLVSRLPPYTLPPDLGPKMYMAYGSLRGGTQQPYGTTCLHMDVADAVNLMVHVQPADEEQSESQGGTEREGTDTAGDTEDEIERLARSDPSAGAIWDIWTAEDEPKLSAFLWRVAGHERTENLIAHPVSAP
mmetsp:Transcript_16213/g.41699  ORF Transcript_16213/g.41699 Transcript_16213/m.41699 type:complete len:205 (+) Transcript_16213:2-616(+)